MELALNHAAAWKDSNVCCCCLKSGCFKDISTEYHYSGQKEVYESMLKDTFDIQIPRINSAIARICDDCVTKLQDATSFKAMVLHNQGMFNNYLESLQHDREGLQSDRDFKMKCEPTSTESHHFDHNYDDDELLSNIKLEITQNEKTLNSEDQAKYSFNRKKKLKKCKIESNETETQKNWTKILERRGSGPILRENSLKLIENSTACVFQWYRSRYTCFCCKQPCPDFESLRYHTNTSHTLANIEKRIISQQNRLVKVEISALKCKLCDQQLENLLVLKQHLIEFHHFEFPSSEDLLVPFRITEELTCQICFQNFKLFRILNIHMNRHFQNQICHICGAGFSNLVFLNLHKSRTHSPLKCKQCDVLFNNKIEKKHHEREFHNVKFERKLRFPCPYCEERFYQENIRVLHLVEKHGHKKPEHKCTICCKVFITKSLCNNHLKNVHMKEKVHECDVCHNMFYTRSDVTRHKVTHSGEKKFCCETCHNLFASKDSLRRHIKRTHVLH